MYYLLFCRQLCYSCQSCTSVSWHREAQTTDIFPRNLDLGFGLCQVGNSLCLPFSEIFGNFWLLLIKFSLSFCCSGEGQASLQVTVPDTITEWNANIFCVADSGFGLSHLATLRVFQPFFVDLSLPYSVIQGEIFSLKAIVFNYLKDCIQVSISQSHILF